jgi:predicted adenylyl cyclase CyaB
VNRNIEIKARATDFASQMEGAAQIADGAPEVIWQEDTFFKTPRGRLKLRKTSDRHGELIYYERSDLSGPKECRYLITKTREPELLGRMLGEGLGVLGIVSKQRTVYLVGQTRIHFDDVEGLGQFIELEVVLRPEQGPADGERIARGLMEQLSIRENDLVERAYVDLIEKGPAPSLSAPGVME